MRCMMAVMLLLSAASLGAAQQQFPTQKQNEPSTVYETVVVHVSDPEPVSGANNNQGAVVTVNQLRVTDKLIKELERSNQSVRAGDLRASAEHLEKALAMEPDLPLVHNALGARYTELQEYSKALKEFQWALELRPTYRLAADNAAALLCMQHHFVEAEPFARRALAIEPKALSSQYLLGGILVELGQYTEESTKLLEQTKWKYSRAWLLLALISEGRGRLDEAQDEVRGYLRSPSVQRKQVAEEWLARLEQRQEAQRTQDYLMIGQRD